ncbi:hypothetical protein E2320_006329 [Naja naja]|nr:hypothetical protein E2320_006329 [Naja naja]
MFTHQYFNVSPPKKGIPSSGWDAFNKKLKYQLSYPVFTENASGEGKNTDTAGVSSKFGPCIFSPTPNWANTHTHTHTH